MTNIYIDYFGALFVSLLFNYLVMWNIEYFLFCFSVHQKGSNYVVKIEKGFLFFYFLFFCCDIWRSCVLFFFFVLNQTVCGGNVNFLFFIFYFFPELFFLFLIMLCQLCAKQQSTVILFWCFFLFAFCLHFMCHEKIF